MASVSQPCDRLACPVDRGRRACLRPSRYRDLCSPVLASVASPPSPVPAICTVPAVSPCLPKSAPSLVRSPPVPVRVPFSCHRPVPLLLSRHQLVKAAREDGAHLFLAYIHTGSLHHMDRPDEPDPLSAVAQSIAIPLLRSFADVFPADLPAELPPRRDVDHRIELEPGAISAQSPHISSQPIRTG